MDAIDTVVTTNIKHLFLTGHPGIGKTTIIVNTIRKLQKYLLQNDTKKNRNYDMNIHGFYTEECRNAKGDRIGFDILHWNNINEWNCSDDGKTSSTVNRVPLSRSVDKVKKSDPHVGKYLVNLDNVEKYAIPSIIPTSSSTSSTTTSSSTTSTTSSSTSTIETSKKDQFELIILDEIGKMEMLCPNFLPTVFHILDEITENNATLNQIVFGTIPTPRYGRVIPAIEDIRARDDVIVLHVTKDNRHELGECIFDCFTKLMDGDNSDSASKSDAEYSFDCMNKSLEPYLYKRVIGATSMDQKGCSGKNAEKDKRQNKEKGNKAMNPMNNQHLKPCGPLHSDTVEPKILLVGVTASEQPKNIDLAYCERSMWKILGTIHKINYNPTSPEKVDVETYTKLKNEVLSNGVCIWDILANVHIKESKEQNKNKRRRQTKEMPNSNDIKGLLKKYPLIKAVCFIGKKAHATYLKVLCNDDDSNVDEITRNVDLIVLPSSSPSNSRMTDEEKARNWNKVFSKYL